MENRIINYKDYVISTEEGTEKRLFFRSPLQKIEFNTYAEDSKHSAWKYFDDIQNPIRRLYEFLIGNRDIVKNIKGWTENENWFGFHGNILCLPFYFKRDYRKLKAISTSNNNIQEIRSYGYESEFNICGGDCDIERTSIKMKNGKTIKIKRNESYYFTYEHIIKDIIDTGNQIPIEQ